MTSATIHILFLTVKSETDLHGYYPENRVVWNDVPNEWDWRLYEDRDDWCALRDIELPTDEPGLWLLEGQAEQGESPDDDGYFSDDDAEWRRLTSTEADYFSRHGCLAVKSRRGTK